MKNLIITYIQFPDIPLHTRDGHKLRGFFGNLFREHSPLLHNHFEDGRLRYAYPLVQYKVINKVPYLVGLQEGAELLIDLFLKIKFLEIGGQKYTILSKNIERQVFKLYETDKIFHYKFLTPWMALNQQNYKKFVEADVRGQKQLLRKILTGNILSFYKSLDFIVKNELDVVTSVRYIHTNFKNKRMLAFVGEFAVNAVLPDLIGLGKSVSRGFGAIKMLK